MKLTPRQVNLLKHTYIDYQQTSEFLDQPLIVDKADGLYYWDIEGKRYFDAIGGIFVVSLGHRHPRLHDAVRRQMEKITFAPPLHGIAEVTLNFIEKIGSVTPGSLTSGNGANGGLTPVPVRGSDPQ